MTKSVHKSKVTGGSHFGSHIGYLSLFDGSNSYTKFERNQMINDSKLECSIVKIDKMATILVIVCLILSIF